MKIKVFSILIVLAFCFSLVGVITPIPAPAAPAVHPKPQMTVTICHGGGNAFHVDVTLVNRGEDSLESSTASANGIHLQLIGATVVAASLDKGAFDEFKADFTDPPSVVELYKSSLKANDTCTASFNITVPQLDDSQQGLAAIKYRAWITDEDDQVGDEPYVARDPGAVTATNPTYNDTNISLMDYDGHYLPVYRTNSYNTLNDAIWLYYYNWARRTATQTVSLLDTLRAHGIHKIYAYVGGADDDGNYAIDPNFNETEDSTKANAESFIKKVRDYSNANQYQFQVLADIYGDPASTWADFDVRESSVREKIVQFCRELVDPTVGFDGIHFDYEYGWSPTDPAYDAKYIQLLNEVKDPTTGIGTGFLSLAIYSGWVNPTWRTSQYVASLAGPADEIVLMAYESGRQYESYREWVREETARTFTQVGSLAEVVVGVSYTTGLAEDMAYALVGALQGATGGSVAVAIWLYSAGTPWDEFDAIWHPTAIDAGIRWLRCQQDPIKGSWYNDPAVTSFAVLTMLNWGYDESDEIVSKGIDYIMSQINRVTGSVYNNPNRYTYYTSIAMLALAATGNSEYHDEIRLMRQWLIDSQWDESSIYGSVGTDHWYYGGFGYGNGMRPDLSNTQWALMGLKAADRVLGMEANETYNKCADFFLERCRNSDGGSAYVPGYDSYHSITAASVWSYSLCGRGNGEGALGGIQWLADRYSLTNNDGWGYWSEYYYKVTLAKALSMTHRKTLGDHNWFEELAAKLADEQLPNGNWPDTGMMGSEISTCWAIMALQTNTLSPRGEYSWWAKLESHCDLHVYDPMGRHTGVNYETGMVEEEIPGADFTILDSEGNEVPYSGTTPGDGHSQLIDLGDVVPGSYRIELLGTSDGPYHLTVAGFSEGTEVSTHAFQGVIAEGERLATNVVVTSMEGALTLFCDPLTPMPVLDVDPTALNVVGPPGTGGLGAFTVSEIGGVETIHGITCYCTDIAWSEGVIDGDAVTFDLNDFVVGPGGSQVVNVSVPVPADFQPPGTGSIIVESIDGGTRSIALTLLTDITPPSVAMVSPPSGYALQDGVTFVASATDDVSGVNSVTISIREADGDSGIPIGYEDLPAIQDPATGNWTSWFDTLQLQDGYYVVLVEATDNAGNATSIADPYTVPYSIRNWASLTIAVVGKGSVSRDPDQTLYTYGTGVTLTAKAASGWTFVGWSGDFCGNTNPVVVTMNGDKAITATFIVRTKTLLCSAPNPSAYGQRVTFTALVLPMTYGSGMPKGTVTFKDAGITLGTGTLNAWGVATFSTSSLSLGKHSITATYEGAVKFNGSTSSALSQKVKACTTVKVISSNSPSVYRQSVTFTATVVAKEPGTDVPTGKVTFKEGHGTLGTSTLDATGHATYSTSSLYVGAHCITAVYVGDDNYCCSTSSVLSQSVKRK